MFENSRVKLHWHYKHIHKLLFMRHWELVLIGFANATVQEFQIPANLPTM